MTEPTLLRYVTVESGTITASLVTGTGTSATQTKDGIWVEDGTYLHAHDVVSRIEAVVNAMRRNRANAPTVSELSWSDVIRELEGVAVDLEAR